MGLCTSLYLTLGLAVVPSVPLGDFVALGSSTRASLRVLTNGTNRRSAPSLRSVRARAHEPCRSAAPYARVCHAGLDVAQATSVGGLTTMSSHTTLPGMSPQPTSHATWSRHSTAVLIPARAFAHPEPWCRQKRSAAMHIDGTDSAPSANALRALLPSLGSLKDLAQLLAHS